MTAPVIPLFNHNSRARGIPAAQRHCVSPQGQYTNTIATASPEASPGVSGRLLAWVIAAAVFNLLAAFVWWVA